MLKALGSIPPELQEKQCTQCHSVHSVSPPLQRSLLLRLCLSSRRPGSKHKGVCVMNTHTIALFPLLDKPDSWGHGHPPCSLCRTAGHSLLSVALCLLHVGSPLHVGDTVCRSTVHGDQGFHWKVSEAKPLLRGCF